MVTLHDKKMAHETKFAHDEAERFAREARDVRIFGAWTARMMGVNGSNPKNAISEGYASMHLAGGKKAVLAHAVQALKGFVTEDEIKKRVDAIGSDLTKHAVDTNPGL